MILLLTCEHCKNKTLICCQIDETEILCAYGECHKISKVNEIEKLKAYVLYLEEQPKKTIFIDYPTILVKTPNDGTRLIRQDDFNSIQWALTQNIKDLK